MTSRSFWGSWRRFLPSAAGRGIQGANQSAFRATEHTTPSLTVRRLKKGYSPASGKTPHASWHRSWEVQVGRRKNLVLAASAQKTQDQGRIHCLHTRSPHDPRLRLHRVPLPWKLILPPALNRSKL